MEKIKNPEEYEICKFDGVGSSTVYIGSFDNLERAKLEWHKEYVEPMGMELETLTLDEIKEQIKEQDKLFMITVFISNTLSGEILQYGNYGDSWWKIGTTCGYA